MICANITDPISDTDNLQWRQIFDAACWGVVIGSADGERMELMNRYFAEMHGYDVAELQGQPIVLVFAPTVRAEVTQHIALAHQAGHYRFESRHMRRDGSEFPVLIDVTTVRNELGEVRYRIVNVQDVTDFKRIEEILKERESQLRRVVDTQRELICRWNLETRLVFVNQAFCRYFNQPQSDLLGVPLLALWPEAVSWVKPLLLQPQLLEAVYDVPNGDGEIRRIALSTTPVCDDHGHLLGFQSSGSDITESFRLQRALSDSERRVKAIFNSMFQFLSVLTPGGVVLDVNDTALNFAGVRRADAIGRYFWTTYWWRVDWHTQAELQKSITQAAQGHFVRYEVVVQGLDARRVILDFSLKPVTDDAGAVELLIAEGRDITASRQAEQRAAEHQARFSAIADNIPGIVFQLCCRPDAASVALVYVSPRLAAWCGSKGMEAAAGRLDWVHCVLEEDRGSFIHSLRGSVAKLCEWTWCGRLLEANGGTRWVNLRATPRLGDVGSVMMDGAMLDISDLKLAESQVDQSRELLRSLASHLEAVREEERKRMAREVHDELGQRLTALRMEIGVLELQAEGDSVSRYVERARSMKELVDGAISQVRNVATALRPAALDMGLEPALVWLAGEIEQRCGLYCSVQMLDKNVHLPDEMATVLFRIVQESLTNVVRHAKASKASIILGTVGHFHILEIRDNGVGFDVATRPRQNAYGLLGIQERASMLGGKAVIRSTLGAGTIVAVEIPVQ